MRRLLHCPIAEKQQTQMQRLPTPNQRHARHSVAYAHDRAAVVATAVMQIVQTAPPDQQRQAVENYLRDEFADIEHQVAAERGSADDA